MPSANASRQIASASSRSAAPSSRPGQDVRVEIDQSCANASRSSRAARIPAGTYSATRRSFGEWICESGRPKPVITVGDALVGERRHDRQRAAGADQRRPAAERALERVEPELDHLRVGRDEPGRSRRPQLDLDVRAGRSAFTQQPLDDGRDLLDLLPGRETDRHVRDRLDRQHRLLQERRAGRDAVHVDRRLGERAQVEVGRGRGVLRPRALLGELVAAGRQLRPARELLVGRHRAPDAQLVGQRAVMGDQRRRAS